MSQMDDILSRLNQLTEEVRDLQARTSPKSPPVSAAAFTSIADQIKSYTQTLHHQGERYICHCVLDGDSSTSVQVTWLGALREDDSYSTARYCLALANEHRIRILKVLAGHELTTAQLTGETGLEGGPLYHHLKELMAARFVQQRERSCYQITPRGLDALLTVGALNRRNTWDHQGEVWQKGDSHED